MTYERHYPGTRLASQVGISVALRKVSKSSRNTVVMILAPEVLREAGMTVGGPVSIHIGKEQHLGKLVIRQEAEAKSCYTLRKSRENSVGVHAYLTVAPWKGLPETKQKAVACDFDISDTPIGTTGIGKSVYVTLPEWAGKPVRQFQDHKRAVANNRL